MRTKEKIQSDSLDTLNNVMGDRKVLLIHQHLVLEVFVDIRDILNEALLYYKGIASPWSGQKGGERNGKD